MFSIYSVKMTINTPSVFSVVTFFYTIVSLVLFGFLRLQVSNTITTVISVLADRLRTER